jgi:glutamine synthetase
MTPSDVLKLIKEKQVKFADLRFTDTRGKEQHVSIPARLVDEDLFRDGKMFDGSSIAGWKGINESDMILMPDAATAVIDPFFEETTVDIRCDVIEPTTMQGYERDPRSLAKRAEAYLKSTGIADSALFGPENEFFIFDSVRYGNEMRGSFYEIDSVQGAWNSPKDYQDGNKGHRPGIKGGYFPVPPVDAFQDIRSAMCLACEEMGLKVEVHHHEVATAGQSEIGIGAGTLVAKADQVQILKWRTATARPPPSCPSPWSGTTAAACTCTSRCRRRAGRCSPATSTGDCRTWRSITSAASSSTPAR